MELEKVLLSHKKEAIAKDHPYCIVDSPKVLRQANFNLIEKLEEANAKIDNLQHKCQRQKRNITSLKDTLDVYRRDCIALRQLLDEYSDFPIHLFRKDSSGAYSNEAKRFAVTLYSCSKKAYEEIKDLPSSSHMDGSPGLHQNVLKYLQTMVGSNLGYQYRTVALMVDGMSIRKRLVWDASAKRLIGYVDYGAGGGSDETEWASEMLCFMVVGILGGWKLPISYYLINGCSAQSLATLISRQVEALAEYGLVVASLTLDGHASNMGAIKSLGCDFQDPGKITNYITVLEKQIHVILDACHCLKLARNILATTDIVSKRGYISWKYISKLGDLQASEGLRLGNRLTSRHIQFQQQKMKVSLAAQTLSRSVAESLRYLRWLQIPEFMGSEATEEFILYIDEAFDMLNSRSTRCKDPQKTPITSENVQHKLSRANSIIAYLASLRLPNGQFLFLSQKKTFAVGFMLSLTSIFNVYTMVNCSYLNTYRLSQDHLELFFNSQRRYSGWNNNPSALILKSSMRSVFFRAGIKPGTTGNVIPLDDTPVDLDESDIDDDIPIFSRITVDTVQYIAGWLVRKLVTKVSCERCCQVLYIKEAPGYESLISVKSRGQPYVPSKDLMQIILFIESKFRQNIACHQLRFAVLKKFGRIGTVFSEDVEHFVEIADGLSSHYYSLLCQIFECQTLICANMKKYEF